MTWDDARALEAAGHRCASHTMTHPRLAQSSAEQCRAELAESRACLERELGHAVSEIAYPFGSENGDVRRLAAECGYTAACTVRIGLSGAGDDAMGLHRVPVLGSDSLMGFASRVRTGYTVRDRLRELARSVIGARRASRSGDNA
jgi:peptidoglycan/xylan/chitin deacetylase (PgdA/CDA1 family)